MSGLPLAAGVTPAAASRAKLRQRVANRTIGALWWVLSIGCFAGLWELAWAARLADPLLLPPPHIFLSKFADH